MWAVCATLMKKIPSEHGGYWWRTHQIPTFYLDENVQGIVNKDHAEKIARTIIDPCGVADQIFVSVEKL